MSYAIAFIEHDAADVAVGACDERGLAAVDAVEIKVGQPELTPIERLLQSTKKIMWEVLLETTHRPVRCRECARWGYHLRSCSRGHR